MKKFREKLNLWNGLSISILVFSLIFIVYPLFIILNRSFFDAETGAFSLQHFYHFFDRKYYWVTIINSLNVTIVSTILAVLIGLPLAYMLRKVKIFGSKIVQILIIVSYISPPFIGAYAWIQLLGRSGVITQFMNDTFNMNFDGIYGFSGIVLVLTLQSFPLVFIYIMGALKNLDNSLVEAAESLGYTNFQRVRKVIVPLIIPTILASALLVFMRVIADFGTPMLIGEGYRTIPVVIYQQFMSEVSSNAGFAAAIAAMFVILTICLFIVQKIIANQFSYSMSALRPMQADKAKGVKGVIYHTIVYAITFLAILPQLVVIYTSFLETSGGQVYTGKFSLDNYRNILFNRDLSMITNTYKMGLYAIIVIIVVGILIAYLTVRKRNTVNSILDTFSMFPFVIPGSVLGIALVYSFSDHPLFLTGTGRSICHTKNALHDSVKHSYYESN